MIKKANTVILLVVCFIMANQTLIKAESQIDSIEIRHGYRCNEHRLSLSELMAKTETFEPAFKEMKIAQKRNNLSYFFLFMGGAGLGWQAGTVIAGGDPNWTLAAIAGSLVVISIPIQISARYHKRKSVLIYNRELREIRNRQSSLNLGSSKEGLSLALKF